MSPFFAIKSWPPSTYLGCWVTVQRCDAGGGRQLSPKSTVSRANTAGVAVRLYELGGVDLDTITALEKDWTQAAQLPLTGWFTKNIDVEGDRQVTVYISEEASIRSYFTVIAVPNGVDTQQFLEDEGWIDLMDQRRAKACSYWSPARRAGAARRRRRPTWTPPLPS